MIYTSHVTQQSSSYVFMTREMKLSVHTKIIENVYSSFIHKHQKMETTQMSINRWLYKQTVVKSYNGILISNKKEWVTDKCNIMNEFQMQYMLSESNQTEKAMYSRYDLIQMTFWKRQNYWNWEWIDRS